MIGYKFGRRKEIPMQAGCIPGKGWGYGKMRPSEGDELKVSTNQHGQ
jgi:hypothetical protein